MRFCVIKLKSVLIVLTIFVAAAVVCITSGRAIMTFMAGGREIPIYSVERSDNKIALTFDCAWNDDDIDEIIDILKKYDCKATFFVTGKWAEQYSSSLNKLYRSGFEIGIHSYNHDNYTKLSKKEILADMEKCDNIIKHITGSAPPLVRVPSGSYDDNAVRTIEKSGRMCIQWSVDGLDYTDTTSDDIYNRVINGTSAGDIILLHNGTKLTAKTLPRIIETLKGEYELVSVSELVYKEDYVLDHTGRQSRKNIL